MGSHSKLIIVIVLTSNTWGLFPLDQPIRVIDDMLALSSKISILRHLEHTHALCFTFHQVQSIIFEN